MKEKDDLYYQILNKITGKDTNKLDHKIIDDLQRNISKEYDTDKLALWLLGINILQGKKDTAETLYNALKIAISRGDVEAVELLIQRGADVNADMNNILFDVISPNIMPSRNTKITIDLKVLKLLLEHGATIPARLPPWIDEKSKQVINSAQMKGYLQQLDSSNPIEDSTKIMEKITKMFRIDDGRILDILASTTVPSLLLSLSPVAPLKLLILKKILTSGNNELIEELFDNSELFKGVKANILADYTKFIYNQYIQFGDTSNDVDSELSGDTSDTAD